MVSHSHKLTLVTFDVASILTLSMLHVLYIFSVNIMLIVGLLDALLDTPILNFLLSAQL